jgi:hypothetical protein
VYRDDRARRDAAIEARSAAVHEIRERLDAIAVLNEQVKRRGLESFGIAPIEEGVVVPSDLDALSLAEQMLDDPEQPFVVHELGCAPRPDHRGEWTGLLSVERCLRVTLWTGASLAFLVAAAARIAGAYVPW